MRSEELIGLVGTGISTLGTALQVDEVLRIISMIITIIGGVLTLIVMPLINWYNEAKKDGKIDAKEIKEGVDIVSNGIEQVKEDLEKEDKK